MSGRKILAVATFSSEFDGGRLFDPASPVNRDGSLVPFIALAEVMSASGWRVRTADQVNPEAASAWLHLDSNAPPPVAMDPSRTVLMMFEPEVVSPYWYRQARQGVLPYRVVYTHRRDLVRLGRPFEYLHWPQTLGHPQNLPRTEFLVMINGRKYPAVKAGELYSAREHVASWFARRGLISVYGNGWDRSNWKHPISALRTSALRSAARGTVASKFEVLGRTRFILCFENMVSPGYHTEKLFDAIAGGVVPVYLGDPTITDVVPAGAFIDYRDANSPAALLALLQDTSEARQAEIRASGSEYLNSEAFRPYTPDAFARRLLQKFEDIV